MDSLRIEELNILTEKYFVLFFVFVFLCIDKFSQIII